MYKKSIFWFRQDMRTFDNIGLMQAAKQSDNLMPIFILDKNLQNDFGEEDQRFLFIYELLKDLKKELNEKGSDLFVFHGKPEDIIPDIVKNHKIDAVFSNYCYDNYGKKRDKNIGEFCKKNDVEFVQYTDYLILPPEKIEYRKVFTPFYKKWRPIVDSLNIECVKVNKIYTDFDVTKTIEIPDKKHSYFTLDSAKKSLASFDFENYESKKDFPAITTGTSRLSPFLRFGKISPRWLFKRVEHVNESFIKELAWREFWHHVRYNFPDLENIEFQERKRGIQWINNDSDFEKFYNAETGYPIVDAAIKELKETNYMHGRVRMLVASFMTKNLLIDWKKGEKFFKEFLLDYDESVNIGNWQWSASVGPDPKPMRVFSPIIQSQKFDSDSKYVKKYIPELSDYSPEHIHDPMKYDLTESGYPKPMVHQKESGKRAREYYKGEIDQ